MNGKGERGMTDGERIGYLAGTVLIVASLVAFALYVLWPEFCCSTVSGTW